MKISGGKSPYLQDREGTIPGQVTGSGDWKQTESHPDQSQDDGRQTRALMTMEPPLDRWNLLYLTLVLHGVGTLMPWNIFINAKTVSYVSRTDIKKSMLHTVHVHTRVTCQIQCHFFSIDTYALLLLNTSMKMIQFYLAIATKRRMVLPSARCE